MLKNSETDEKTQWVTKIIKRPVFEIGGHGRSTEKNGDEDVGRPRKDIVL